MNWGEIKTDRRTNKPTETLSELGGREGYPISLAQILSYSVLKVNINLYSYSNCMCSMHLPRSMHFPSTLLCTHTSISSMSNHGHNIVIT